jgi:diguanylate cyclase (GGDEF)-like protein
LSFRLQPRAAFAWLACALLVAAAARGQATNPFDPSRLAITQYRVDGWQTEQGLPQNTAQAMFQSRDGYLWVGTGAGLARFDGVRFATFESSPVPDLATRPIFGFMEDSEGALWIGHSRGATRYRGGRFERVIDNDLMQGRRVWAFAQDRAGVVWAATENGLVRWEKGAARLFTEDDGLPTRRLRSIDIDTDGTIWIGTTGGGLVSYAAGRFEVLGRANGFPHPEVRHVLADPAGGVWAATAGAGLVRVNGGRMKTYTTADGLPTDQLTYLARDKFGALWIGTWGAGVSRMVDGRFSSIAATGGLGGDQIWSVHVDHEGSVWVGTWNSGLSRLSARSFVVFGQPEGLAGDNVRTVIHARDGSAWVASAGGGVNRVEGGKVTTTITRKQGLPTDEASALFEDRDGAIWVATYTNGVARVKDGRIQAFGTREGLPNVDVRVIYRDRSGTLWAGTVSGLARFDGRVFVPVREPGAPPEGATSILEDRAGTLWIGTSGEGLYGYRDGRFTKLTRKDGLASNWIVALYEDSAGSLWIGTNGEGINRLRDGRIATIGVAHGLWDGLAQVFLEDKKGYLWMTCNRGFYRVLRSELDAFAEGRIEKVTSEGYGPGHALRTSTFAGGLQPAGAIDSAGFLWLPSLKGLVIVDPARLPDTGEPPRVFIEEVAVDGRSASPGAEVVLPPGSHPLSVRFTAGTLIDASRARFRYQLEGISPNWVDAGRSREAAFPALPAGRYLFRVATSVDGKRWREAAAPLPIVVEPRFYESKGFILLAALASLAGIAALFNLRTRQLRSNQAQMERLVAAKTEELRVANEHLSRLSFADALTGLSNRRHLDETLQSEWRRAQRSRTSLGILIADIDAFKAYNDSLGHPEGDRCLVAVADVIRASTGRAGDFAARYGGEEFVILIPGADRTAALAFAEGLRKACEARAIPHPASAVSSVVTLSLGVAARIPEGEAAAAGLFAEADAALYRAKQDGRNRVR